MLEDHQPLFALRLTTPRLTLRVPREDEAVRLAEVAARGVHAPGERPFLLPWAEAPAEQRARTVLRNHWARLAEWSVADWSLGLAVFVDDEPIGSISLWASDFAVVREVGSASWLGLQHQRQGYGTEARTAALALAFGPLGAQHAVSQAFPDNTASVRTSRRLGYVNDGIARDVREGEAVTSLRLRLSAQDWTAGGRGGDVVIGGWERARAAFGL